ncbi:MAG: hypothetical protein QW350_05510 [Candidatus Aenigmatarchaeota archaeon]|jgi:hypothetical protein
MIVNHNQKKDIIFKEEYRVCSIDPALNHFAFRIEKRTKTRIMTEVFECFSFNVSDNSGIFLEVKNFLDKYREYFRYVDIVVIEKQLPKNFIAQRISIICISYFILICPDIPFIYEVDPRLKRLILDKGNIKKKSIEKAEEILLKYQDHVGYETLKNFKKKDDLSDTVCQVEALFKKLNIFPEDIK